jgi:1,4-dihydroxy-6-naphthoate synthase
MSNDARMTIAYTPDSDDAFYYFALETGRVPMPGFLPDFLGRPISELNRAALDGTYDVTAISSVTYPMIADRYAILSVGTSVGRGYGPVLVSKYVRKLDELRGRPVGVPGASTTGSFLLRWLCPEAILVPMHFDAIGEAAANGEIAAGVMIHEELLYYPQLGLHRVMDLGAEWCLRTELPLPVGLNVVRRDLGRLNLESICASLRSSLEYGLAHQEDALEWVSQFGRGKAGRCTKKFVEMFANEDSLHIAADVRQALRLLLKAAVDLGVGTTVPALDIIEGTAVHTRPKTAASLIHQGSNNG